jgi:DNA helicase-2/ATP-dependent DNA helicase PcrA
MTHLSDLPKPASLNERQWQAVCCTSGPLMVLAGAGSGKTKMLTSRIFHLIKECQIPPYQVLAVTFTNKAATEMRERVERELNSQASVLPTSASFGRPEIGTFHSICVRVLRRSLPYTPFSQPFVIFDDSDQLSLIKSVLKKLSIDEKSFSPKAFQAAINRAKCDARDPQEIQTASMNVFYRHLRTVYEEYQKDLFANNALDFGEIICMTYRIFRDHPELREKFQKQFQYIHVDEYQDTNRSQYLLLSMLAKKANGGHESRSINGEGLISEIFSSLKRITQIRLLSN